MPSVVHSNLKDLFEVENKIFTFNNSFKDEYQNVEGELEERNTINDSIFNSLKLYISEKVKRELSNKEEEEIFENFSQFLFENGTSSNNGSFLRRLLSILLVFRSRI